MPWPPIGPSWSVANAPWKMSAKDASVTPIGGRGLERNFSLERNLSVERDFLSEELIAQELDFIGNLAFRIW